MIAIIDYGAGNLRSVKKAFDYIGAKSRIVSTVKDFKNIDKLVLPGVGAFGAAVERLKSTGFLPLLKEYLSHNGQFLGICLGMQLLMEASEEAGWIKGLEVFNGTCKRFPRGKVPQIGWNKIRVEKKSELLNGIGKQAFFYFNHGFYVSAGNQEIVSATTDYYISYVSVIESRNIFAVQFHPEKSGSCGLKLLRNWVERC